MKKLILGSFIALTVALLGWGATDNVNAVSIYDNPRYTNTADAFCSISNDNFNTLLDLNEAINDKIDSDPDVFSDWDIYSLSDIYDPDRFYWIITTTEPNLATYTYSNTGQINLTLIKKDAFNSFTFGIENISYNGGLRIDVNGWNGTNIYHNENIAFFAISSMRTNATKNRCSIGEKNLYYGLGTFANQNPINGLGLIRAITFTRENNSSNVMTAGGFFDDFLYNRNFKSSIYISTMPFTPPPGFDGVPPPDVSSEIVNYVPNWYVSGAIDWKVQIHDINFNTFDNIPFLCDDDLAPVLHWEIWDRGDPDDPNDHTLLDGGYFSATAQIDYQLPKLEELKHYRIIGYYECGDSPLFDQSSHLDFKVDQGGNLDRSIALNCIIPEFPFINFRHCQLIIEDTLNILVVGSYSSEPIVNPSGGGGGWTIYTDNCHTLTTVGDWLNLSPSQRYICPNFPSSIRSIISPFVGFFLGLGTVIFIARRASGDSQ